jgi:hypothetical protein
MPATISGRLNFMVVLDGFEIIRGGSLDMLAHPACVLFFCEGE